MLTVHGSFRSLNSDLRAPSPELLVSLSERLHARHLHPDLGVRLQLATLLVRLQPDRHDIEAQRPEHEFRRSHSGRPAVQPEAPKDGLQVLRERVGPEKPVHSVRGTVPEIRRTRDCLRDWSQLQAERAQALLPRVYEVRLRFQLSGGRKRSLLRNPGYLLRSKASASAPLALYKHLPRRRER